MYHNSKQSKKPIKYIPSNKHYQSTADNNENIQKYNNLIMYLPTKDNNTSNKNTKIQQHDGLTKHQAKHCRSLVDLNNSQVSSMIQNESKEPRQLSVREHPSKNSSQPHKSLKYLSPNPQHYSSVTIQNSGNTQTSRNPKRTINTKVLNNSSNSIQNITKKYFGNKAAPINRNTKCQNNNKFQTLSSNRQMKNMADSGSKNHKNSYNIQKISRTGSEHSILIEPASNIKQKNNINKQSDRKHKNNIVSQQQIEDNNNYNLLIKLKNYIEQLKNTEQEHLKQIQKLQKITNQVRLNNKTLQQTKNEKTRQNNQLAKQNQFLRDQFEVMRIREQQLIKKIKKNGRNQEQNCRKKNSNYSCLLCKQKQLIICSLKNVMNEQLNKIVQLQKYKLIDQENKKIMEYRVSQNNSKISYDREQQSSINNQCQQSQQSLQLDDQYDVNSINMHQLSIVQGSNHKNNQKQVQIYSFKKNNHNSGNKDHQIQSQRLSLPRSQYIIQEHDQINHQNSPNKNINPYTNRPNSNQVSHVNSNLSSNSGTHRNHSNKQYISSQSNRDSLQNVPQPYYEILSTMSKKNIKNSSQQDHPNYCTKTANSMKQQQQPPYQHIEDSFSEQQSNFSAMSEDQILIEVGNYLQSIKRSKFNKNNLQDIRKSIPNTNKQIINRHNNQ